MMKKTLLIAFLFPICTLKAQIKERSAISGFNIAADVHVLGWASTYFQYLDKNSPTGFGGGFRIGYGINEMFEPYAEFNATSLSTADIDAQSFTMTHFDAGLRINLAGNVHPVRPFIEGGYTYLRGSAKQVINGNDHVDLVFYGGKPHVGGGLRYFFKIPMSVFARRIFTVGKKSNATLDGTEISDKPDVTTFRISAGFNLNLTKLSKSK